MKNGWRRLVRLDRPSRNETPILHVRPENARAVELYRRLGFADRRKFRYTVIRNSAPMP